MAEQDPKEVQERIHKEGLESIFPNMDKITVREAVKEGVKEGLGAYFDGIKTVLDAAYSPGMQHFAAHGAHELVAALVNGSAFVMYPRSSGKDDEQKNEHGVHGPDIKAPETPQQENQHERGRSR
jgi:hypothetical protein